MSKQLDVLDNAYNEVNALYNQRSNENPMQKAYAQGLMSSFAENLKNANQQNAAMAAVGGGMSPEQIAAQKAANAQNMGGVANAISTNAEQSQQAYDQMKVNATQNIAAQKVQTLDAEQARKNAMWQSVIAGASGIASKAVGGIWGGK